ncbi:SDR family NAD(P)-dependent oxidoreductase [Streptomyces sp. NEAU-H22]|uniref:non-ribosomal peptide synthetase n=1 Tax=unclassified Streptomyces TaxID=2593676 RepID=UPI002253F8EE|nr:MULTISPECIES: non-ribosomal peptide synthetase [unclassified Streptomyces]MCX3292477.1 SDR family NAD(P)-dependent oxidoreductase [Streptomyces sp. NEAU-H22]WMD05088.1 SDR family NAD(P)-dependent oxidoreductase [Streptomyces sp. FXY-T5]
MTALDAVGVLDDITAAALKVPGVDDAVAVVRKGVRAAVPQRADEPAPREPDLRDGTPADLDGGPLNIPEGAPATLQEALRAAAELAPDKGTIFITKGHEDVLQTYPALLAEAERVLAGLRFAGLRPGDAALFQFDDNKAYLSAFWACVLGGFVPTPVGVATTYRVPNETNRKLHNAWNLLGQPVLLTDDVTAGPLAGVRELWSEPEVRILTVGELAAFPPDTEWFEATPESPVLNLLTSGSTGVPKCVHHTNASVVARSLAVAEHCGLTGDDISLIWMPFDHVTVAMYNVRDVFLRCMHINAKIEHSLGDPLLWLDWVDRYRATNTWAPNFAFAMANEHAEEIRTRRSWDLSCLREITNAGEPVVASTSHRFLELLAPHGLPADAMRPVWGMSETCSGVTYARQRLDDKAAGTVAVDPSSLSGNIRHLDPRDKDAVVLSSVGRPLPGVQIRVVDDTGKVVPEGRLGELRIRGLTMMHGYFANDDANRESYDEDGWFRTGDLAFVHNGEVVIAGRKKDQIIVRGINYMAHEIESVVEQVDGVRVTFAAAAGVREPGAGTDQLVVFFVPLQWDSDVLADTTERVRATLVREVGIAPDLLVPVAETEFPKTGSGKIQRGALVDGLRAGTFDGRAVGTRPEQEQTDTWLFRRQWAEVTPAAEAMDDSGVRVVFAEDDDLRHLDIDGPFVTVRRGESFAEEAPDRYRVRTDDRAELRRLLAAVASAHGPVSTVVHALPLTPGSDPLSRLTAATAELTSLVGALADAESGRPLLLVVTAGSVHVHDGDSVDLGTCALPALVRTAVGESTSTVIRQLDLPADTGAWAQALRTELADRHHTGVIAARQGRRWQPRLSPVEVDGGPDSAVPPVIAGGTYLVTGGLGGIAQDIASYLVAAYGARLLLVGRSPADGAGPLAELAALGDVVYQQLDVADAAALAAAVAAAEARWGRPLDGALHLAGADPTAQWADLEQHTVATESAQTFAVQYRAKVAGTLAVADVLASRPDASLVLFGSVNGEFGGHSFGAYSAANGFLIGFADHWHHERRRAVHCLSWSMWAGIGMNRTQSAAPARSRGFRSIEPADGLRLFLDAIASPHHGLIIGLDLANPSIIDELVPEQLRASEILVAYTADGVEPEALRAAVALTIRDSPVPVRLVEVPHIPRDTNGTVDTAQLLLDAASGKAGRRFTAPETDLERRIASLWSDSLNRPEIGREDSFFDLGGNSIRATRLLALVDDTFAVRVATQELYENPTVAGMAEILVRQGVN